MDRERKISLPELKNVIKEEDSETLVSLILNLVEQQERAVKTNIELQKKIAEVVFSLKDLTKQVNELVNVLTAETNAIITEEKVSKREPEKKPEVKKTSMMDSILELEQELNKL